MKRFNEILLKLVLFYKHSKETVGEQRPLHNYAGSPNPRCLISIRLPNFLLNNPKSFNHHPIYMISVSDYDCNLSSNPAIKIGLSLCHSNSLY